MLLFLSFVFYFILFRFIYFEREGEMEEGKDREGGRHRIRAGSRLRAAGTEPDAGLEPTNLEIMT